GAITIGTLVQFVSLFEVLAFPLRLIGFVLSDIPRAVVGRERVQDVFDEPITLPPAIETRPLPDESLGVSVRSVTFAYEEHQVLSGISFDVAPNESVALVGPTGSGKSTLTLLLVRLADPDHGSIDLGGVDLRRVDGEALHRDTAIVFQESFLFATSVRENIALNLDVSDEEIRKAARMAQAEEFIDELPRGFDTVLGERGVTLSGGQRQRVALARAVIRRPRLLILDDATSAVDPTVEAAILAGLRDSGDLGGPTVVVVAYRKATISLADEVVYVEHGVVVDRGSHEELLERCEGYRRLLTAYEREEAER